MSNLEATRPLRRARKNMRRRPVEKKSDPRVNSMAALYRNGHTLKQIGERYSLTGERVRQLLKEFRGMNAMSGGQHVAVERKARRAKQQREARFLKKYGCTSAEWQSIRDAGHKMVAEGIGIYRTPLRAFCLHRRNANTRGVGWELTLWEWWSIWQASGKWGERGTGQGYVMCRKGDEGPYAVGNVFIALAIENNSETKANKAGLPIGVCRVGNRYIANRMIGGKRYHLGSFETPELAHAAYLAVPELTGFLNRRAAS